ncbi:non-ribosomal peptide synthetase-like protein [Fluviicoccus keumensis]|uniref:Non-ribosomal peptide synthetase-like protein n=1 Tax=Fluviicoccus keumensis TaxID=1435465 RepID=A0A4Q7ZBF5_9GAMM|nr:Pls/PosA family non-ribosomal peptide synthetase [Fluviicoccus keumensis]RZU47952.1 non-ribosomal peptide synthetase-like protein [Fluviicoccus keumensis]
MPVASSIVRGDDRPDLLQNEILADLFEATAAQRPEHPALVFGCRTLSYRQLDELADRIAHGLIGLGVGAGQIVGLWLPRGPELLAAQLAIAKAGAAWLPFDMDTPVDRIQVCLDDAAATGLLTTVEWQPGLAALTRPVWTAESLGEVAPGEPLRRRGEVLAHHPAYVIYTSGSTGKPKGIVINQGRICHFLRSENAVLGVRGDDRVYQGFSVAFDMSFEEIWISYLVGATLWLAPKALTSDPEALPKALQDNGITVLHAVPTLLALFVTDVPSLRIINLGGEMCPDAVVERWANGQRQVFNTYGPTEATVSASLAELQRGQPVTIGKPLPNYGLLVMGAEKQLLPTGEVGELCIFGPGVAQSYLGRPDLTAEKFIVNDYAADPLEARLYRTGDLATIDANGVIQCLGRVDDQVKIRGFRVELGEIEAALCDQPGIGTAAVVVRQEEGIDQLIAFIVAEQAAAAPDLPVLRQALRDRLPPYMVPGRFEVLTEQTLPRLTSGKIDRKALRAMPLAAVSGNPESDEPENEAESVLFAVMRRLFPGQPLQRRADFFDDLGGHSLLAARLVSGLRGDARFGHITIQDIYRERRLGALAERMMASRAEPETAWTPRAVPPAGLRRVVCGVAQAAALPLLVVLQILKWLAPFFTYHELTGEPGDSIALAIGWSLVVFLLSQLAGFAVAIAGNRLLLAGIGPGRYPLWGFTFFRWWLADRLTDVAPVYFLYGSTLYTDYLRALGARVGHDVTIGSMTTRVPGLITLGDGVSIGSSVNLDNARVERGELVIGTITLGREAHVGSYAVLEGDTVIADHGQLQGLSALADGGRIGEREVWDGSPSRRVGQFDPAVMPRRPAFTRRQKVRENLMFLAGMVVIACLFFIPIFPTFILVDWLDTNEMMALIPGDSPVSAAVRYFLLAVPASALMIVVTALLSAAIRWTALPRLQVGTWPVHSRFYYRKWFANQIQESSLQVLHGVYATVFAPTWYRLLGARVGRGAEISTAMGVVPDMLTLGDESFIADAVMLGDEEVRGGWMTLQPTVVGHRTFIGNGAYIPDGTTLPDNVLIGVQSKAPEAPQVVKPGDTWFGSPSLYMPAREVLGGFSEELTYAPSVWRKLGRAAVESLRIVLPLALTIGVGYMLVLEVLAVEERHGYREGLLALGIAGFLYGLGSFVFVWLLKWLLIGRYRPRAAPMWTWFVWVSEAITSLYEAIVVPNWLNYMRGTPLLPFFLRLMGTRIGRGAYLDTTDVTEFDCVEIGDGVELNNHAGPQTHLFEDRIMKIGRVKIGNGVTVRARGTILYDAEIGADACLGPLTLVMKGEHIPPASAWSGSPAAPDTHR